MQTLRKYKLSLGFLLVILLFLFFGVFTIRGIFSIGHLTRTIYNHPLVVSNAALNAALETAKMHRSMKDAVLSTRPEDMEVALALVSQGERKVYQYLDIVRANILGEKGQQLEKQTRLLFDDWEPIRYEAVSALSEHKRARAIRINQTKGADHTQVLEEKMLELTSYARAKADSFLSEVEKKQSRLEKFTLFLTLSGVLLSFLIAVITIYHVLLSEKNLLKEKASLEKAMAEIKTLHGIIPICSHCKQIRDDKGSWSKIEQYIHEHSDASFSHGICPDCITKHYPDHVPGSSARARKSAKVEK